jgi:hypothetical protein
LAVTITSGFCVSVPNALPLILGRFSALDRSDARKPGETFPSFADGLVLLSRLTVRKP